MRFHAFMKLCRLASLACGFVLQVHATAGVVVSSDGQWRLLADEAGRSLLLQDALGMQHARWDWPAVAALNPHPTPHQPVQLLNHPVRQSFLAMFGGTRQIYEISYNPKAEPLFDGLVHDYRLGEGLARPGFLGLRQIKLDAPLDDFWPDPGSPHVVGLARWASGSPEIHVINLDIRRVRTAYPVPIGTTGLTWQRSANSSTPVLRWQADDDHLGCLSLLNWVAVACGDAF